MLLQLLKHVILTPEITTQLLTISLPDLYGRHSQYCYEPNSNYAYFLAHYMDLFSLAQHKVIRATLYHDIFLMPFYPPPVNQFQSAQIMNHFQRAFDMCMHLEYPGDMRKDLFSATAMLNCSPPPFAYVSGGTGLDLWKGLFVERKVKHSCSHTSGWYLSFQFLLQHCIPSHGSRETHLRDILRLLQRPGSGPVVVDDQGDLHSSGSCLVQIPQDHRPVSLKSSSDATSHCIE